MGMELYHRYVAWNLLNRVRLTATAEVISSYNELPNHNETLPRSPQLISSDLARTEEEGRGYSASYLNEAGSKVEAEVAMCPPFSLFRREENRDGDTCNITTLHNY